MFRVRRKSKLTEQDVLQIAKDFADSKRNLFWLEPAQAKYHGPSWLSRHQAHWIVRTNVGNIDGDIGVKIDDETGHVLAYRSPRTGWKAVAPPVSD
jgi:hypothetical protein